MKSVGMLLYNSKNLIFSWFIFNIDDVLLIAWNICNDIKNRKNKKKYVLKKKTYYSRDEKYSR